MQTQVQTETQEMDGLLLEAYQLWARLSPDRYKERQVAWDHYVQLRDSAERRQLKLSPARTEPAVRRYTH